ncbi:MAG: hypothetical protein HYS06_02355 [Methylocystis sp.]|nr:hypothetical protein [Methylocystis sp.]
MKLRALVTAGVIIAGIASPCLAFENPLSMSDSGTHVNRLLQTVSCNVNDNDKQARCVRACDDEYIMAAGRYSTAGKLDEPKAAKKACETKCGC